MTGTGSEDPIFETVEETTEEEGPNIMLQTQDPHSMGENINDYQALMNFFKGNIGTGMLSMPIVFKYAGLWCGLVLVAVAGALSTYLMQVLLRTANAVRDEHGLDPSKMDYTEAVFMVLKYGPYRLRKPKGKIKHTINGFLIITQVGFCCVYTLFITENIRYFIHDLFPGYSANFHLVGALVCLALIPMCLYSNMKLFAYLSILANFCTLTGMAIIFVYIFYSDLKPSQSLPAITDPQSLLIAFSMVMFSFEGISLVLPIQSKMRSENNYGSWFGVLNMGMVCVVCLNIATGFFGYLKFGDQTLGSITLNMPEHIPWVAPVKPLFIVAILVSYLLQFYVPASIFGRLMEKLQCHREGSDRRRFINLKLMRVSLVLFTYIAAVTIPRLELMISLIGSLASSVLAFIMPALLEIVYLWPKRDQIRWFWLSVFTKHVILILIGLTSFFGGTITTLSQLIKSF